MKIKAREKKKKKILLGERKRRPFFFFQKSYSLRRVFYLSYPPLLLS